MKQRADTSATISRNNFHADFSLEHKEQVENKYITFDIKKSKVLHAAKIREKTKRLEFLSLQATLSRTSSLTRHLLHQ